MEPIPETRKTGTRIRSLQADSVFTLTVWVFDARATIRPSQFEFKLLRDTRPVVTFAAACSSKHEAASHQT